MEIQEKLVKYKYHIAIVLIAALALLSVIYVAPRFITILAYFWPLFVSTAMFLVAVVFLGKTSSPAGTDESAGQDKPGNGLLDFVEGHAEQVEETYKLSDHQ